LAIKQKAFYVVGIVHLSGFSRKKTNAHSGWEIILLVYINQGALSSLKLDYLSAVQLLGGLFIQFTFPWILVELIYSVAVVLLLLTQNIQQYWKLGLVKIFAQLANKKFCLMHDHFVVFWQNCRLHCFFMHQQ